jgi:hypothetical protein
VGEVPHVGTVACAVDSGDEALHFAPTGITGHMQAQARPGVRATDFSGNRFTGGGTQGEHADSFGRGAGRRAASMNPMLQAVD